MGASASRLTSRLKVLDSPALAIVVLSCCFSFTSRITIATGHPSVQVCQPSRHLPPIPFQCSSHSLALPSWVYLFGPPMQVFLYFPLLFR
ncbi:hypothetical protein B0T09DRAFT_351954 [Sordaria sp. MPI-SDFR-AT-0083]|nr:hypothetical protein B0T09DRAFT_351954 [Sordaria sp. MPI-SDFR-AT-0083]